MVQVYTSSVIDAGADTVWSRIRDFNALPQWHPGIADSRIENSQPSDRVGCIRHFHLKDGGGFASSCWPFPTTNTAAPIRSSRARWASADTPPPSSSRR